MMDLHRVGNQRFRRHRGRYLLQSALAAVTMYAALVALRQQNLVIAASLAATAFIVFAMPGSVTAKTRSVIGGHLVGLGSGCLFAAVPCGSTLGCDALYALAVGCSIFVMVATHTEHPPAAGTALGVVMAGHSPRVVLGVLIGVAVLALFRRLLKPYLIDLVEIQEPLARPEGSDPPTRPVEGGKEEPGTAAAAAVTPDHR